MAKSGIPFSCLKEYKGLVNVQEFEIGTTFFVVFKGIFNSLSCFNSDVFV